MYTYIFKHQTDGDMIILMSKGIALAKDLLKITDKRYRYFELIGTVSADNPVVKI